MRACGLLSEPRGVRAGICPLPRSHLIYKSCHSRLLSSYSPSLLIPNNLHPLPPLVVASSNSLDFKNTSRNPPQVKNVYRLRRRHHREFVELFTFICVPCFRLFAHHPSPLLQSLPRLTYGLHNSPVTLSVSTMEHMAEGKASSLAPTPTTLYVSIPHRRTHSESVFFFCQCSYYHPHDRVDKS